MSIVHVFSISPVALSFHSSHSPAKVIGSPSARVKYQGCLPVLDERGRAAFLRMTSAEAAMIGSNTVPTPVSRSLAIRRTPRSTAKSPLDGSDLGGVAILQPQAQTQQPLLTIRLTGDLLALSGGLQRAGLGIAGGRVTGPVEDATQASHAAQRGNCLTVEVDETDLREIALAGYADAASTDRAA
jgi:hypothetical protein